MAWPPSSWDEYIANAGSGLVPTSPPVAPPDEWNDGAGPAANAEVAQQQQAATRVAVQDAADAALGPEGGAAFWKGTDRAAFYDSNPEAKRAVAEHDYEQALGSVRNAATNALGSVGPRFVDGMLQQKYSPGETKGDGGTLLAQAAPRGRAYIAQATGPVGTIGQIREELPIGAIDTPLSREEAQQIDIDPPELGEMPDDFVGKGGLLTPPILGQEAQPDAVSGGATAAQQVAEKQAGESGKTAAGQTSGKPGDVPDEYLSDEELGAEMSRRSPEEQAMFLAKIEAARDNFAASRALEESEKAARRADANLRIRDESIKKANARGAELELQAKQIADTNPTDTIPAYKKVFGVLAAFVGGFAANKTGRNMGLEVVDQIANEAAQQQAQRLGVIAKQRAGVGEQIATTEDTYHAAEAARIATYDAALKGLQSEIHQYNPRGTTAARVLTAMQQIQGKRGELVAQYQAAEQKRIEAALKAMHEQEELNARIRHDRATEATDRTRAGSDWIRAQADAKRAEAEAAAAGPKGRKAEADATKAEAEAEAAKGGFYVRNPETREPLVDKKGNPVAIPDAGKRERLEKQVAAAKNIRMVADRMKALKEKNGGNWQALGSDEAQEMKSLVSMIDFETFKAFDLGAPSQGDRDLAEGVRGGADPSSFVKRSTQGFQTYADAVEKKVNTALGVAGIEPLRFARRSDAPKAEKSASDVFAQRITNSDYKPTKTADPSRPWEAPTMRDIFAAKSNKEVEEAFTALEAFVDQPGETGDQARKSLVEISQSAPSAAARTRAKAILDKLPSSATRTDEAR